ncbi:MAG: ATP-binding protein [Myxococcota bacterium]
MSLLALFRAPLLEDPEASRAAAVLAPLLTFLAGVAALISVSGLTLAWSFAWQSAGMFVATGAIVWARWQVQKGRVELAAALTTGMLFVSSSSSLLADSTSAVFPAAFALAIGIGGITLRRPGPLWLGGLSAVAVLTVDLLHRTGSLPLRRPVEEPAVAVMVAIGFVGLSAAIHWANRALQRAQARAAEHELRAQELQQSLFRRQRMEAVGRLAGAIAHDFNNILTVVAANAAFLAEDYDFDAEARDACDAIVKAADGGASLTRRLLAFGGREVVRPEVVEIADVVLDFRPVLEHMGDKEKTLLQIDMPEEVARIRVDPGQLQHAVANLVVNAAHASEKRGTVRIELESVVLDEDRLLPHGMINAGRYHVLRVADEGAGMDAQTMAAAVEPFFTTRGNGGGSGLGLAVVHAVVTRTGGQIELQSEVGEGTTVSLWFPQVDEPTTWKPVRPLVSTAGTLKGMSVLLVDDTDAARQAVRRQLEQAGASVLEARSAEEALALVADGADVSAAVVDAIMPGMSGPELVTRLRDDGFEAPVTFLTGYAEPEGLRGGVAANTPVLYKPASTVDLVNALTTQDQFAAG